MRLYEVTFDKRLLLKYDNTTLRSSISVEYGDDEVKIVALHHVMDITDISSLCYSSIKVRGYFVNEKNNPNLYHRIFMLDIDYKSGLSSGNDVFDFVYNKVMPIIRNENISKIIE